MHFFCLPLSPRARCLKHASFISDKKRAQYGCIFSDARRRSRRARRRHHSSGLPRRPYRSSKFSYSLWHSLRFGNRGTSHLSCSGKRGPRGGASFARCQNSEGYLSRIQNEKGRYMKRIISYAYLQQKLLGFHRRTKSYIRSMRFRKTYFAFGRAPPSQKFITFRANSRKSRDAYISPSK